MFGSIGGTELLVIMVIVLLVFGPKKLPELGRTIGKGLGEFRRASNDLRRSLEDEIALDERLECMACGQAVGNRLETINCGVVVFNGAGVRDPDATVIIYMDGIDFVVFDFTGCGRI